MASPIADEEERIPLRGWDDDEDDETALRGDTAKPRLRRPGRQQVRRRRHVVRFPSSLDLERVVNEYSIQATRDRLLGKHTTATGAIRNGHDDGKDDNDYQTFASAAAPPPPRRQHRTTGKIATIPKPTPLGYTGRTASRWALTVLTGLLTGIVAIVLVAATEWITHRRSTFVDHQWRHKRSTSNSSVVSIFVAYAATNLALALVSAALCLVWAPAAVGSGIPEVKAYLNGVRVRRFSSARLFLVKILGTILSVSSGLAIGPEGPLVHMGAILGASCTKISNLLLWIFPHSSSTNRLWTFLTMDLAHFATDAERRDLVSIGAAAGFAAAFGAPIGGLLFAMEEASSYVENQMFLKTLVATAIATFCLAIHKGDLSKYSIIEMGDFQSANNNIFVNRVEELPLYILMGVAGGVLGGVFCQVWKHIQFTRQRLFPDGRDQVPWKMLEVAVVSLLTSSLVYFLPMFSWTCRQVSNDDDVVPKTSLLDRWTVHSHNAHQFDCDLGEINEMAAIFFGSREAAIGDILSDPTQFHPYTLWTTGILFYVLMVLTLGVSLPSGIFMPTFLSGSSLGGAAGMVFQGWISHDISPSTFALLGAAGLLAGIQRSTVSICVILVEGTGQVKTLIPVIITVVLARYVADLISKHGLYETAIIDVSRYPYLEREEKKAYDMFTVADIMSTPVVTLGPRERVQRVVKLLRQVEHNGFPVVDPMTHEFLGLVRRDQLVALLEFGVFEKDETNGDSRAPPTSHSSGRSGSTPWTPQPGVGKSPLMNLAYHINDDRYDDVNSAATPSSSARQGRRLGEEQQDDDDLYDTNAWIDTLRQALAHWDEEPIDSVVDVLNDDLPVKSLSHGSFSHLLTAAAPAGALRKPLVETNRRGNLFIAWMDPAFQKHWVRLSAVMNRGTYCVPHYCPLSKAHRIFTTLGLRHLIVLGEGGQVVGVLTRINFLKESIQERTGVCF